MELFFSYFNSYCLLLVLVILAKLVFKKKMTGSLYKLLWLICMFRLFIPMTVRFDVLTASNEEGFITQHMIPKSIVESYSFNTFHLLFLGLYFVGVSAIAINMWIKYKKIDIIVETSSPLPTHLSKLEKLMHQSGSKVEVRYSDETPQPFAYGILKPKIILPESVLTEMSDSDLDYVIVHEMTHVLHKDALIKRLSTLLCVVHWFNPLVWLMDKLLAEDIEMSCDEAVVEKFGLSNRDKYAELLLVSAVKGINPRGQIGFLSSSIAERIKTIMFLNKPQKALSVYITTLVSTLFFCVSFVGYKPTSIVDINSEEKPRATVVKPSVSIPEMKSEEDIGKMSFSESKKYLESYYEELATYLDSAEAE